MFGASSAVLLITAAAFMAFGSGSVQDWNTPEDLEIREQQPEIPEEEIGSFEEEEIIGLAINSE